MKLITVQNKSVLDLLRSDKIYIADIRTKADSNLMEPYLKMMDHYKYLSCPIFACVIGRRAEFDGAKFQNDPIILELDVPDEIVKLQSYYDWTDVIYFTEWPDEWDEGGPLITFEQFTKDVFNGFNTNNDVPIQATLPFIKPEWFVNAYEIPPRFIKLHNRSGGRNVLTEDSYK